MPQAPRSQQSLVPRWWLLIDGRPEGPHGQAYILACLNAAQLRGDTLACLDGGQDWRPLSSWPQFAAFPPPLPAPPPAPIIVTQGPASGGSGSPIVWWLVGGLACCVFLCGFGLAAISMLGGGVNNSSIEAPVNPQMATPFDGNRTLAYWSQARESLRPLVTTPAGTAAAQRIALTRQAAAVIDGLPTLDVDPDALEAGMRLSNFLRWGADIAERQNDPAIFFESVLRGAAGDPLGTYNESRAQLNAVEQEYRGLLQHVAIVRTNLTARYRTEFPSLTQ